MTLSIEPIHPNIGGRVSGIELSNPLTADQVAELEAALNELTVLVFKGQELTDDQQKTFTLSFGAIENARGGNIRKREDQRLSDGLNDVSNLDKDGKLLASGSRQNLFNTANMLWHSDSSFRAVPARYSILSARVVNPVGGDTEFANMRAAYDALDQATKDEIEDLVCEHSLMYSRGALGFLDFTAEERETFKPVRQKLVRRHPSSGRKSLFLSSHAGAIDGLEMPIARILLADLTEHATREEFVYVHKWQAGDVVIWDNQQTMHRVRRYDSSLPRDMRRTTVAGTEMTIEQAA